MKFVITKSIFLEIEKNLLEGLEHFFPFDRVEAIQEIIYGSPYYIDRKTLSLSRSKSVLFSILKAFNLLNSVSKDFFKYRKLKSLLRMEMLNVFLSPTAIIKVTSQTNLLKNIYGNNASESDN